MRRWTSSETGVVEWRSHAHRLRQALDLLAVAVDAVAQVGGGAGVVDGAQGGGVAAGGEGIFKVLRGGGATFAFVLALAFASPSSLLLSGVMRTWKSEESGNSLWSNFMSD